MGNIKRLLVVLLVCMISIGCVACSGTTSEDSKVNLEDMTGSEKVDYFITKGKNDYEAVKNDDDKLTDLGVQYIKDIGEYVDNKSQFDSDDNMEDIMTKGSFLEQYGKDKMEMFKTSGQEDSNGYKTAKEVNSLGMNAVQMVKYVYREAEIKEDDSTKANIKQVKESLEQLQ
ncbi:hypothetical protein ACSSOE_10950 [Intestinibacter bartlettii]|jgi:hypothetical protein|uniref:hypothetical protein n=1 Tax=Intestinibacter bartlettii TaxID=261299 RepID=UPI001105983A|nr:hypothetical protein [Intestinibacter bartlettii]